MSENNVIFEKIHELNKISEEYKRIINYLCVFDNNVILITNEDKVLCSGSNSYGILGLGHQNPVEDFIINRDLSNKQIISFKNSLFQTVALNTDGKLYFWGNKLCSLNGRRDNKIYKPMLNEYLIDENIIDYCCGGWHILVLTENFEVFAWGANDFGQIGIKNIDKVMLNPSKVLGLNGEKVKAISCGSYHSMALTKSGCVYSWGYNNCGQLGVDNGNYEEAQPQRVLIETKIDKMVCGSKHSLFLSHEGNIYVCGNNEFGQLGLSMDKEEQLTPIKLSHSEKFIDIASHYRYNISAALSNNGFYYVWGECGKEGIISEPKETPFKSFNELFVNYWNVTYENLKFSQGKSVLHTGRLSKGGSPDSYPRRVLAKFRAARTLLFGPRCPRCEPMRQTEVFDNNPEVRSKFGLASLLSFITILMIFGFVIYWYAMKERHHKALDSLKSSKDISKLPKGFIEAKILSQNYSRKYGRDMENDL